MGRTAADGRFGWDQPVGCDRAQHRELAHRRTAHAGGLQDVSRMEGESGCPQSMASRVRASALLLQDQLT